ncbi:hypothetical protein J2128_001815 [Methanomicrobium sp. W14]|uniref:hypothetical protein n=1 Tax=Methanomicrobium sp. W14 TaxID=2817839 RepID=UPI001AE8BD8B|nr:hypothetical protein [Methanomicrobium sp. W14]MBP2133861.1 hypothetical protein [Methanomicrobium sp. W14]
MSILSEAVDELEKKLSGSGCDHGTVSIKKAPGKRICPYVDGECLVTEYGGKSCEIVTSYPLEVNTKVSFMYGRPLKSPVQRTAACAIINTLSNFLCFTRIAKACDEGSCGDCLKELVEQLKGKKVYLNGNLPGLWSSIPGQTVDSPEDADIIIVSGDGLFDNDLLEVTEKYLGKKRVIFTGPSTAGVCVMKNYEHWCPYGKK